MIVLAFPNLLLFLSESHNYLMEYVGFSGMVRDVREQIFDSRCELCRRMVGGGQTHCQLLR